MSRGSYRLSELAQALGLERTGDGDPEITGAAGLREAGAGEICFLDDRKLVAALAETGAAAVILAPAIDCDKPALRTDDPRAAFARVLEIFETSCDELFPVGIDPTAVVAEDAELGEGVRVGPHAVIGAGSKIGAQALIGAGVVLEPRAEIGEHCRLYARVVVRERCRLGAGCILHPGVVIGSDGFGYHPTGEGLLRIPQIGIVVLEDRVEVGANACIDRATTGETRIGAGTKIDNLVQVGHNVSIGCHCAISAQTGISGSCRIGNGVVIGGQVGMADHLTLGDGVKVAAKSGITRDVPDGTTVFGYPAIEFRKGFRVVALTHRLPEMQKRLEALEAKIGSDGDTEEERC